MYFINELYLLLVLLLVRGRIRAMLIGLDLQPTLHIISPISLQSPPSRAMLGARLNRRLLVSTVVQANLLGMQLNEVPCMYGGMVLKCQKRQLVRSQCQDP